MNNKTYVDIVAKFNKDGHLTPITIVWEDGRRFDIQKIVDVRQAVSLKAGRSGVRYICKIENQLKTLFLDGDKWFVEKN